jgi:hypothetical protein
MPELNGVLLFKVFLSKIMLAVSVLARFFLPFAINFYKVKLQKISDFSDKTYHKLNIISQ